MDLIQRLNILAEDAGYDNISPNAIKVEDWGDRTSTTILYDKNHEDAFVLTPAVAVPIKMVLGEPSKVPVDYKGPVAVHRALLSYGAMTRIKTTADLKSTLQPIINAGIVDLINQVGHIGLGFKLTMVYPGYTKQYFRELENSAAYEIRLFLTKE